MHPCGLSYHSETVDEGHSVIRMFLKEFDPLRFFRYKSY